MTHAPLDTSASLPVSHEQAALVEIDPRSIAPGIEAILFSTDRPVKAIRLAAALGLVREDDAIETESAASGEASESPANAEVQGLAPPSGDEAAQPSAPSESPHVVVSPKHKKPRKRAGATNDAASTRARALDAVRAGVEHLNQLYTETGRSFRIESLAGGFRVMTLPEFAGAIAAFQGARARTSLSPAALEALAIVSYKQPITRAKLEAIRGVACGEILRSLMERRLVTIVGRAEELGRPMLYGTTARFLEVFGLSSLKDLPTITELQSKS